MSIFTRTPFSYYFASFKNWNIWFLKFDFKGRVGTALNKIGNEYNPFITA